MDILQAMMAGREAARATAGTAGDLAAKEMEMRAMAEKRLEALRELAAIQGLTKPQIEGALKRDPATIQEILTKPGGPAVLGVLDKLIPTAQELRSGWHPTARIMELAEEYRRTGKVLPGYEADISQIPSEAFTPMLQGRAATATTGMRGETAAGVGDVNLTGRYLQYLTGMSEADVARFGAMSQEAGRLREGLDALEKSVRAGALEQMTNLQWPGDWPQAIAAKMGWLARLKGASLGGVPDQTRILQSLIAQYKLRPGMDEDELRKMSEEMDKDAALFPMPEEGAGHLAPPTRPAAIEPPPRVAKVLGRGTPEVLARPAPTEAPPENIDVTRTKEAGTYAARQAAKARLRPYVVAVLNEAAKKGEKPRPSPEILAIAKAGGLGTLELQQVIEEITKAYQAEQRRQLPNERSSRGIQ